MAACGPVPPRICMNYTSISRSPSRRTPSHASRPPMPRVAPDQGGEFSLQALPLGRLPVVGPDLAYTAAGPHQLQSKSTVLQPASGLRAMMPVTFRRRAMRSGTPRFLGAPQIQRNAVGRVATSFRRRGLASGLITPSLNSVTMELSIGTHQSTLKRGPRPAEGSVKCSRRLRAIGT